MIKVTVLHRDHSIEDAMNVVAEVTVDTTDVNEALNHAYRYTQNIDGSWSRKEGSDASDTVKVMMERPDGRGLRSSMIEDRFMVSGECLPWALNDREYECVSTGFRLIRDHEYA
jgi:hypothetical protein